MASIADSTSDLDKTRPILKPDGSNYYAWSKRTEAFLVNKQCWEAVSPGYAEGNLTTAQAKSNTLARAILFSAVDDAFLEDIGEVSKAKEVWETIAKLCATESPMHTVQIMYELFLNRRKTKEMSMQSYISAIQSSVRKIASGGLELSDKFVAYIMLMNLPMDEYEMFIRSVQDPTGSLSTMKVKSLLLAEERRAASINSKSEQEEAVALALTRRPFNGKKYASKQSSQDDDSSRRTNQHTGNKPRHYKCFVCGQMGHIARSCPEAQKDKLRTKERSKVQPEGKSVVRDGPMRTNGGPIALCTHNSDQRVELTKQTEWYVDSGATDHIIKDSSCYDKYTLVRGENVKVGDGAKAQVTGIGSVQFKIADACGGSSVVIHDVMHVPSMDCNLLSVAKMTNKGVSVTFGKDSAVAEKDGQVIFKAHRRGDVYILSGDTNGGLEAHEALVGRAEDETTEPSEDAILREESWQDPTADDNIWHRRLGHVNQGAMSKLPLPVRCTKPKGACVTCTKAKMCSRTFPKVSKSRASAPLELIHSDLIGRISPKSLGGASYAMTIIDDHSRFVVVKLLKQKSETVSKFKEFRLKAENMTERKIKIVRTDNGGEYIGAGFSQELKCNGIQHQRTNPYSPQQNGRAERMNRTLMEMARCLMIQAGVPKNFWAEALNTAAYIRNRCPSRSIDNQIPVELWTGKPLQEEELMSMRTFGCRAWALRPKVNKLDDRCEECVFLGYEDGIKGYRLWSIGRRMVIIRRDVVFEEDQFPFAETSSDVQQDQRLETPLDDFFTVDPLDSPVMELEDEVAEEEDDIQMQPEHIDEPAEAEEGSSQLSPEGVAANTPAEPRRPERLKRSTACGRPECKKVTTQGAADWEAQDPKPKEPMNYKEATSCRERGNWKEAMDEEISQHERMGTWEIVPRPPKTKTVTGSAWKYKMKLNQDGSVSRFKARLVAQGFSQEFGKDYWETYNPVVKGKTLRTMLALSIAQDLENRHVDVQTAFLNSDIEEEIYMEQPAGYEQGNDDNVCRLKKCIYGLKQSGNQWYKKVKSIMLTLEMIPTRSDPCLFVHKTKRLFCCLYVDDLGIFGKGPDLDWFVSTLSESVKVRDLGEMRQFLGINVNRVSDNCLTIDQINYLDQVLKDTGMSEARGLSCPINPRPSSDRNGEDCDAKCDDTLYRRTIGSLLYLSNNSRPDISFAVAFLGQFSNDPRRKHWAAVKRLLRYLVVTRDYKITYDKRKARMGEPVESYCDADFANDISDRKSFSGVACLIAGGVVAWQSKKQPIVALSTQEAEYIAMANAAKEVLWFRNVFSELRMHHFNTEASCIRADNLGAICLSKEDISTDKSKHIDLRYHFLKDLVSNLDIRFEYIATQLNPADLLTKGLSGPKTRQFCTELGIRTFG
jgi:hypothetical protein